MPQNVKVTRKLDLRKRAVFTGQRIAAKTANYLIDYRKDEDSGTLFLSATSAIHPHFTLPDVATANGRWYSFYGANANGFVIMAATNVISNRLGSTTKGVNYGITGMQQGAMCTFFSDGTKWIHIDQSPINTIAISASNALLLTDIKPYLTM